MKEYQRTLFILITHYYVTTSTSYTRSSQNKVSTLGMLNCNNLLIYYDTNF